MCGTTMTAYVIMKYMVILLWTLKTLDAYTLNTTYTFGNRRYLYWHRFQNDQNTFGICLRNDAIHYNGHVCVTDQTFDVIFQSHISK